MRAVGGWASFGGVLGRGQEVAAQIAAAVVAFVAGLVVATLAKGALDALGTDRMVAMFIAGPIAPAAAGGIWVGLDRALARRDPVDFDPSRPSTIRAIAWALLAAVVALAGSIGLSSLLGALGQEVSEQDSIVRAARDFVDGTARAPMIAMVGSALVAAPLFEELFFRRQLFRRLHALSPAAGYLGSACLFAAIHFNPSGFLVYTWLGLVFAFAYRVTGRFWVAVAVHAANNLGAIILLVLRATL